MEEKKRKMPSGIRKEIPGKCPTFAKEELTMEENDTSKSSRWDYGPLSEEGIVMIQTELLPQIIKSIHIQFCLFATTNKNTKIQNIQIILLYWVVTIYRLV